MKNTDVNRMTKALGLQRKIIGVRFLYFRHEYDNMDVAEYGKKTSYCMMVKHAMDNNCFKAKILAVDVHWKHWGLMKKWNA